MLGAAAGLAARLLWERRRASTPDQEPDRLAHDTPAPPPESASTVSAAPGPRTGQGSETPSGEAAAAADAAASRSRRAPGSAPRIAQRVLLHLYAQGRVGLNDVAPRGLSQGGLSEALGTSQSSIAKVLQRLVAAGVLTVSRRHVSGEGRRLLVYELTPLGEALARDLRRSDRPGPGSGDPTRGRA